MKVNQTYVNRAQTFISLTKDKNSLYFRLKHIQMNQTYVNLNYVNCFWCEPIFLGSHNLGSHKIKTDF